MATTCNTIITRAVQYSTANQGLATDTQELMRQLNFAQLKVMDRLARLNRFYYATTASVVSTAGVSGRSVALPANVGRLLVVKLPSGTEVNQVDLQDQAGELKPRYYPLGKRLYEVDSDWDESSAGTVTLALSYVARATVISETADPTTTTVTLDDEFTDLLELDLASYLAHKDLGRPSDEIERLDGKWQARFQDLLDFIDGVAGVAHHRFVIPAPSQQRKE